MTKNNAYVDHAASSAPYYNSFTSAILRPLRRRIVSLCKAHSFTTVLDIGCGTGEQCYYLHKAGISCTGLDISPSMLKHRRHDYPEDIPLLLHNGERLDFESTSFDMALLCLMLHETEQDTVQLLIEALRVARYVIIVDWRMPERNLEVPASWIVHIPEALAGKAHYANFSRFMRQGGTQGFLYSVGLKAESSACLYAGALHLALIDAARVKF